MVTLGLSSERSSQVHSSRVSLDGLQPQHDRTGQLVVGIATLGLLLEGGREGGRERGITMVKERVEKREGKREGRNGGRKSYGE